MDIDHDGSLKLIALCVALAAYISNIRRDMAKRCTSLKEDINEKLPVQVNKGDITETHKNQLVQSKTQELTKIEGAIVNLMWADVPLVLASIAILFHWLVQYTNAGCSVFLYAAIILFGLAVSSLAYQHFKGVRPQFKAAATEGTPKRFIFCQNCVHL